METLNLSPNSLRQALLIAEAHLQLTGNSYASPTAYVRSTLASSEVTAGMFPGTRLTEKEVIPGLKLRSGNSQIEILRVLPTQHEVVYEDKTKRSKKMNITTFIQLANQQGYRKIWGIAGFLRTLKGLLKPVLAAIPLMWILKWIVGAIRKRSSIRFDSRLPRATDRI